MEISRYSCPHNAFIDVKISMAVGSNTFNSKNMKLKIVLLSTMACIMNVVSAQTEDVIQQVDKTLNQFLNVRDFCISQDQDEAYFTVQSPGQEISQIAVIKKVNNTWSAPELASFCDSCLYLEPFLSVDGKRLYFVSDRPLSDPEGPKKDFDIWYVTRNSKNDPWSIPINMGKPINSDLDEFYPSLSENNNLYFTMVSPTGFGEDDIYYSRWEDGNYTAPVLLDGTINSEGYEFNAFISKKEDFILFTKYNEEDGFGSGDLYVSKKDNDGKWAKATNLGLPINTKYMEYCPFYDENTQMLYFTSKRNNLKPRKFNTISDFKEYIHQGDNGLSKIYRTSLKIR